MPMNREEEEEIKRLEDSMVHDEDEEPHPEGWGVYATPKFLSRVIMVVYALMILAMVGLQVIYRGESIPTSLKPESTLVVLPIVIVALYLNFTSPAEDFAKKRTWVGRVIVILLGFVVLQIISVLLWLGMARAFSLL